MAESPKRPADVSKPDASRVVKSVRGISSSGETARAADSVPVATGPFTVLPMQFGRYRIDKLLGKGAMGAVYLAHDTQLDRPVALKVARVSSSGSSKAIQRMETEAKAAAKIDHPNICKVYDFGEIDGIRFIAQQYIEGEDLKSYLDRLGRRREPAEAIKIILLIARALKSAHEKGVIHRDLKPENIMLNRKGEPVIMDFGLARRTAGTTDAGLTQGMIVGTAAYMSPEQAIGKAEGIDHRSDLYALGVVLFEMLTGEWPFSGNSLQVMGMKCVLDAPSPRSVNPDIPPELAELCHKMIAQKKEARYSNSAELIEAMESINLIAPVVSKRQTELGPESAVDPQLVHEPPVAPDWLKSATSRQQNRNARGMLLRKTEPLTSWWRGRRLAVSLPLAGFCAAVLAFAFYYRSGDTIVREEDSSTGQASVDLDVVSTKYGNTTTSPGWQSWPADAPLPAIAPFDAEQANKHQEDWAAYLKVPVEYTNSIGMRFRLIPPGEFQMGSTPEEIDQVLSGAGLDQDWADEVRSEAPQHKVILTQPIYISVVEVMQAEYEKLLGKNPSFFSTTGARKGDVKGLDTSRHPVERVSWDDASDFCSVLSVQEIARPVNVGAGDTVAVPGKAGCRLPTEAEWEFACRAGTTTRFWSGNENGDLVRAGWSGESARGRTHATAMLQANPFGLHDIHGNVWEWVQDQWEFNSYGRLQDESATDPVRQNLANSKRIIRGGGWNYNASFSRASLRHGCLPTLHSDGLGFRVALSVDFVKAAIAELAAKQAIASTGWNGWPKDAPPPAIAPFSAVQAKQHQEAWAAYLKIPAEYTNSISMKFRLIPPGEFMMGSTAAEIEEALNAAPTRSQENDGREAPQHKVVLTQPSYLSIYEVRQKEYEAVIDRNPSQFSATGQEKIAVAKLETQNHPVECTSWYDAVEFCAKLSQRDNLKPSYSRAEETVTPVINGSGYRLPTEAEWEFACRAGTTTKYWIGDNNDSLIRAGWFGTNSGNRTHAAGELSANPLGLYDVHGNVWEWVEDRFEPYHAQFADKPAINPRTPLVAGSPRVIRGGNWDDPASRCRASTRGYNLPSLRVPHYGFRVLLSTDAVKQALQNSKLTAEVNSTSFLKWQKDVAVMSAEQQVVAVSKKLAELNPEFDGKMSRIYGEGSPNVQDGVVTELRFLTDNVADISPVRAFGGLKKLQLGSRGSGNRRLADLTPLQGMQLTVLNCPFTEVFDLSPLKGMPLTEFNCSSTQVADLSPLQGMHLTALYCEITKIVSLSPVKEMPLQTLFCSYTKVSDLSPLKGAPLKHLICKGTQVSDLSHLKGMSLISLNCEYTNVSDLSPVASTSLKTLGCEETLVSDLSPLDGLNLTEVRFTPKNTTKGIEVVRRMQSLERIDVRYPARMSPVEFWKRYDAGEFSK